MAEEFIHNDNFKIIRLNKPIIKENYQKSRERWEHFTKTLEVSPVPLHLDIELCNICNLSCLMCETRYMKRKKGFMSYNLFTKIIDEASDIGIDSIRMNLWGESFLNKDFLKMLKYIKHNTELITQLNSNGLLLSDTLIHGIVDLGLDKITLSVDGVTKKTYEKIRIGSDFDQVTKNINQLIETRNKSGKNNPQICLQIIRMKENYHEIEEFVRFWEKRADRVSVTNINAAHDIGGDIRKLGLRRVHEEKRRPCAQLWQRLAVHWDGNITVCCTDSEGALKIGEFGKEKLIDLWKGKKLNELRKLHKSLEFNGLICESCYGTFKPPE